jgi:hypothetical protein
VIAEEEEEDKEESEAVPADVRGEATQLRSGAVTAARGAQAPQDETEEERAKRKLEKNLQQRARVRQEMISTERTYVESLRTLKAEFADALKDPGACHCVIVCSLKAHPLTRSRARHSQGPPPSLA